MVATYFLTYTTLHPKTIARVCGVTEQWCWEFLADLDLRLREIEAEYRATQDQRRLELEVFIEEIPGKTEIKRQVLLGKMYEAKRNNDLNASKRLLAEFKAFLVPSITIDQNSILIAKQAAITTLLNVDRVGNISCPFHTDKTPSFQITKKNTFRCYGSCGKYGDAIDLYMLLHNVDFKTAVNALNNTP
jgi:hypothetical protein